MKGGQHNFVNLILKHTGDPPVWSAFLFWDLLANPGDGHPQDTGVWLKALWQGDSALDNFIFQEVLFQGFPSSGDAKVSGSKWERLLALGFTLFQNCEFLWRPGSTFQLAVRRAWVLSLGCGKYSIKMVCCSKEVSIFQSKLVWYLVRKSRVAFPMYSTSNSLFPTQLSREMPDHYRVCRAGSWLSCAVCTGEFGSRSPNRGTCGASLLNTSVWGPWVW